jgi:hypothetical protein
MRNSTPLFKGIVAALALTAASSASFASVIFKDGFETGNLSFTSGGAKWTDWPDVTVSNTQKRTGSNAAKFHFGNWAELRFDLGRLYPDVWMSFSLYVPANYTHRVGGDGPNNKFLRVWATDYANTEKIGYSTWPSSGNSDLQADWDTGGAGIGPKGSGTSNFISAADKGKWMTVKIYIKAGTSATAKGTMKLWKNGALVIDDSNTVNNFNANETHGYRYGYLLGAANSGYADSTDFFIDDVVFATTEGDLTGTVVSPPNAPSLSVQPVAQ